jgi:hypothetical protein
MYLAYYDESGDDGWPRTSTDSYRKEIEHLIEDPLPKKSDQSYFIQIADTAAYLTALHMKVELGQGGLPNRLAKYMSSDDVRISLDTLKPSLNLKASRNHEFGIVCYPKS